MLEQMVPGFGLENLEGFREIRDRMNRLFNELVSRSMEDWFTGNFPLTDLWEEDDKYVLHVELPGVKKEDVKLTVQDGVLVLQGERKQRELPEGANYLRNEITYGEFSRSIILPNKADVEKISANYRDGVLEVVIPKKEEEKPKEVKIQVN